MSGIEQAGKTNVWTVVENQDGLTTRKVRKDAKKELKSQGLWDGKENKETRKMFNNNIFKRIWGKGADINNVANGVAIDNKIDNVLENGVDFKPELAEKLRKAGFTTDGKNIDYQSLVQMYKGHAGTNSQIDYSKKSTELGSFTGDLNINGNDVEFSKGEAKDIAKLIGKVESAINWGDVAKSTIGGGGVGAGLGALINVSMGQAVAPIISQSLSATMARGGGLAGAVVATGANIYMQLTRNEKPVAVSTRDLEGVTTVDDYNKYADKNFGKKDATVMKGIAKFFDQDGKLDKDTMDNAMRFAGGEDSVMNKEEGWRLRSMLEAGKLKAEDFKSKPIEETTVEKTPNTEEETPPATQQQTTQNKGQTPPAVATPPAVNDNNDSDCTKVVVQNNESPAMIAKKYGVDLNELIALNPTKAFKDCSGKSKGNGWVVGHVITLPKTADCDKVSAIAKNNLSSKDSVNKYENVMEKKVEDGNPPCAPEMVSYEWLKNTLAKHSKAS